MYAVNLGTAVNEKQMNMSTAAKLKEVLRSELGKGKTIVIMHLVYYNDIIPHKFACSLLFNNHLTMVAFFLGERRRQSNMSIYSAPRCKPNQTLAL